MALIIFALLCLDWPFPLLVLLFEKATVCVDQGSNARQTFVCELWISDYLIECVPLFEF